jgi:hypothetical protein
MHPTHLKTISCVCLTGQTWMHRGQNQVTVIKTSLKDVNISECFLIITSEIFIAVKNVFNVIYLVFRIIERVYSVWRE